MLILRVLNGPLFGAELALPDEDCFIRVVGADLHAVDPEIESSLSLNARTPVLTIPLAESSPNFTLRAVAHATEPGTVSVVVFDQEKGGVEQSLPLNAPVFIGALRIAIRLVADAWSDAVLRDRRDVPAVLPQAVELQTSRMKFGTTIGLALGCLGLITALTLSWPSPVPAQDASHWGVGLPGAVLESSDGLRYVITPHADAAALARRKLSRVGGLAGVRVLTESEAVKKIEQALEDAGIRYFAVRLSNPQRPLLVLHTAISEEKRFGLIDAIAYASDVDVLVRTEREAQEAARRLVSDLGAKAEFTSVPDRFVVSINDYLSDTQLDALGRALEAFRARWGERYVYFTVNQRDLVSIDGVKTGGFGYELRGTRHLFFQS